MYDATVEMSSESYPTISMVIPILHGVTAMLNRLVSQSQPGVMFGKELVKSIKARFPNPKEVKENLLSMVLDPRFKDILLENHEKVLVRKHLKEEILTLVPDAKRAPILPAPSSSVSSIWDSFDQLSETRFLSSDGITVEDEIQMFLKEKTDRTADPMQWWRSNQSKYPNVKLLARKYLAIPATQVSSERLFSTAGNVVTSKRGTLSQCHVEELTFLHEFVKKQQKLSNQ